MTLSATLPRTSRESPPRPCVSMLHDVFATPNLDKRIKLDHALPGRSGCRRGEGVREV